MLNANMFKGRKNQIVGAEKKNLKKPDNTRATDKQMVEKIVNIVEREIR